MSLLERALELSKTAEEKDAGFWEMLHKASRTRVTPHAADAAFAPGGLVASLAAKGVNKAVKEVSRRPAALERLARLRERASQLKHAAEHASPTEGRYYDQYARHTALNLGQAARDARYLVNHPDADDKAPEGSASHMLESLKHRLPSLANNLLYAALPPQTHHTPEDLDDLGRHSVKEWFQLGYKPWEYGPKYEPERELPRDEKEPGKTASHTHMPHMVSVPVHQFEQLNRNLARLNTHLEHQAHPPKQTWKDTAKSVAGTGAMLAAVSLMGHLGKGLLGHLEKHHPKFHAMGEGLHEAFHGAFKDLHEDAWKAVAG